MSHDKEIEELRESVRKMAEKMAVLERKYQRLNKDSYRREEEDV